MLKVIINGKRVALPPDGSITINGENPIFTEDRIPMPRSYPFELPDTPGNLALLGHPDRITSSDITTEYPCSIYFDEVLIDDGVFVREEASPRISGYFKSVESNENFDTPLNALDLGYDAAQGYSIDEITAANANRSNDEPLVFSPIKLFGEITRDGSLITWKNYINYYVAEGRFKRDFLPAIRVGYLLDKIIGTSLQTNPFRSSEFFKVVVQTLRHKNYSYPGAIQHTKLADYLPDIEASRFIRELLKLFCASLIVRRNRYEIVFNRDVFGSGSRVDWSHKLETPYTLTQQKGQFYRYGYADGKEGAPTSTVQGAASFAVLKARNGETTPTDANIRINSVGQTVSRMLNYTVESQWKYDVVNSGFGSDMEKKDGYDATCELRPMDITLNSILNDEVSGYKTEVFCPQLDLSDLGSDQMPRIMLWHGIVDAGGIEFPTLTPYNFSAMAENCFLSALSLQWTGVMGLLNQFHKEFKAWVEKPKKELKDAMRLDAREIADIDYKRKHYIAGRDFLIKSYSVTLTPTKIEPAELVFIEA